MLKTFRASNIDKHLPVVEKKLTLVERCSACGIKSELKVKIVANESQVVMGMLSAQCETKLRGTKPVKTCNNKLDFTFTANMPRKK